VECLIAYSELAYRDMNHHSSQEKTTPSIAIIAIIAALALLGVVVVTVVTIPVQEAEAGCERGNAGSHALNQSKGRCFDRGTF
jgi:uncharacterized membrane protein YjgN (DUF898 family)